MLSLNSVIYTFESDNRTHLGTELSKVTNASVHIFTFKKSKRNHKSLMNSKFISMLLMKTSPLIN